MDYSTICYASMICLVLQDRILDTHDEINVILSNLKDKSLREDMLYVFELQGKIDVWQEVLTGISNGMFNFYGRIAS